MVSLILLWVACGIVSAGAINADYKAEFPEIYDRHDLGTALFLGLGWGPFALLVSFFITGFFMNGWSLSGKKVKAR